MSHSDQRSSLRPTLVIMAAGMGSRYGGLKQMDPVGPNGETLLEYSIYDAIQAGFGKAVFVIRSDFEQEFKAQIGSRFSQKIEVHYVFQALDDLPAGFSPPTERTKPWGTGQAVFACRNHVEEPFAVQNADDFYGREAYQTIADGLIHLEGGDSCMVGYQLKNTLSPNGSVSRGICDISEGYLSSIVEHPQIESTANGDIQNLDETELKTMTGEEVCSMNLWGFHSNFFMTLEEKFTTFLKASGNELKSEWYIPHIVDEMIRLKETQVKVLQSDSRWFGVTYPEDKPVVVASLQSMHENGIYPSKLW